jgi:uncharacterized protein YciI
MLYLLRYTQGPHAAERAAAVYPRHRAYVDRVAAGGDLVLIGSIRPAPGSGALSVFRSREAAEAFAAEDPFVLEGVAVPEPVQEWDALEVG